MMSLRTCRVCGLIALTKADLDLFKRNKNSSYGRAKICKSCHSEYMKEQICRTRELIEIFRSRSSDDTIRCYFCGIPIKKLQGRESSSLVIHSLDEKHDNWDSLNKVPAHLRCHSRYHTIGEKHYNWHGDEASDEAKRKRRERRNSWLEN